MIDLTWMQHVWWLDPKVLAACCIATYIPMGILTVELLIEKATDYFAAEEK